MTKIAIILLNWNGELDTIECVKSLIHADTTDFDVSVIIVDNGSKEDSYATLKKFIDSLGKNELTFQLIRSHINTGFSGGNNIGIKEAIKKNSKFIVLLNNDTVVEKNFLKPLINLLQNSPNAGIVGPKIYFAPEYEYHKDRYKKNEVGKVLWFAGGILDWNNVYPSHRGVDEVDHGQYDVSQTTDFVTGCCLAFRTSLVENIGFLKEYYFVYFEDVDFCITAKNAGYTVHYEPNSIIWHKNAQSSDDVGSSHQMYYQTRNRLIFGMKFAPLRTKVALIRESITMLFRSTQKRIPVADFYMLKWGKKQ